MIPGVAGVRLGFLDAYEVFPRTTEVVIGSTGVRLVFNKACTVIFAAAGGENSLSEACGAAAGATEVVSRAVEVRKVFKEDFGAVPGATWVRIDVLKACGIVLGATEMVSRAAEVRSF